MKRFKLYIIGLVLTSLTLGGCGWMELLPPNGLVFDEYWKSKEDVEATLMGAYSQFAAMDELLFLYGELRADLIVSAQAPNYQELVIENSIFSNNGLANWQNFYKVINYCNNVIKLAPQVREIDQTFTEFQMVSYQSEAAFLRGLAYFYLVRIWKDVPYITEPTTDDNVDFFVAKMSGDSILDLVVEDLEKYRLTIASDYSTNAETKGRATKGAMHALLAEISLWRFEYQECLDYIQAIDDLNQYYLMTPSTWFEMYEPGNSLESIFELQFDGNGQDNTLYNYTLGLNYYRASEKAIELLDPEESLERVRGFGSISIENYGYLIWKYIGGAADQKSVRPSAKRRAANFIIYRYSDVLLMKAEALSQMGDFSPAEAIINEIRGRALVDLKSIPNTMEAFEDAILEERAKELAFEGKRWYDLLRMGRRNDYSRRNKLIEILIEDAPSTEKLVLAAKLSNPDGWYMPILEDELERNANLLQNPYYDTDL